MDATDYLKHNSDSWNQRVAHHLESDFYDVRGFVDGKCSLQEPERELLGDVSGKSILHLQCHFGQDSLSLARRGAHVTGVDFSEEAIKAARDLNDQLSLSAEFLQCDLYSLPEHLDKEFDIVFTSYGTIGWLPDMNRWAEIVQRFLKPDGRFVFAEFHPFAWSFDDEFQTIEYGYFQSKAFIETETGTYANRDADMSSKCVTWNHGLAEVIQPLLRQGLTLLDFQEYNFSPYNCFSNTVQTGERQWRIKHLDDKIPMMFTLLMKKEP